MSVPASSKNERAETDVDRLPNQMGDTMRPREDKEANRNFFTNDPSEYIDSESILPVSESRERLNHFFDETTSTTPAENAKILQNENTHGTTAHDVGEPETFGETQVGKFLKKLFSKD